MTNTHIQHTMASLVTDLAEHPEKCGKVRCLRDAREHPGRTRGNR